MTRRLIYGAFCLLAALGLNCITDYGIITDNNQIDGKGGADAKFGPNPVIDTQGKAHINESGQIALAWPDGTDELLSFVDQKADGTAVLTTFNNFSSGNEPIFHDDLYCNTDRQGCAIYTAPDNNDANLFDGTLNANCLGARSLSLLYSTGRYYGECGKLRQGSRTGLLQKAELFNSAVFANRLGREGLLYEWNAENTSIRLQTEASTSVPLSIRGSGSAWLSAEDNVALLDLRNPLFAGLLTDYAAFLERDATEVTRATVTWNGISMSFTISGRHPTINGRTVVNLRNRAY